MVDNAYVQQRGFHNIYNEDGTIWGFQFCMRTKYYKGLWLSQFRAGDAIVDGVVYPRETLIWNIQGMDYTREEMYDRMDQYWQFGDIATVKVPCPGGLREGYHTVEIQFGWVNNYNTPLEAEYDGSGLGLMGPYCDLGKGAGHYKLDSHATERKLLLVW